MHSVWGELMKEEDYFEEIRAELVASGVMEIIWPRHEKAEDIPVD